MWWPISLDPGIEVHCCHLVQTVIQGQILSVFLRFSTIFCRSATPPPPPHPTHAHSAAGRAFTPWLSANKTRSWMDGENRPPACSAFHVNQHLQQCTLLIERSGQTAAWAEPHTEPDSGITATNWSVCLALFHK